MIFSSTLLALALASTTAEAGTPPIKRVRIRETDNSMNYPALIVVSTGEVDIAGLGVEVEVASDAGAETVVLAESDAWLHGAATLAAHPAVDAGLTLTVYDAASVALATFSGAFAADGTVTPLVRADACDDGRAPCEALDLTIRAAEVFAEADGTFVIGFDLSGASAYDVAYADLEVGGGGDDDGECASRTGCDDTGGRDTGTPTVVEVALDDIGAVWTGALAHAPVGVIEANAQLVDDRGRKLDTLRSKLGAPWADGGAGVNALAVSDDPLTSVALHSWQAYDGTCQEASDGRVQCGGVQTFSGGVRTALLVTSEGWSRYGKLPLEASIALDGGDTATVPANSYQSAASAALAFEADPSGGWVVYAVDDGPARRLATDGTPTCADGACLALSRSEARGWVLSVTAYAAVAAKLPPRVVVAFPSAPAAEPGFYAPAVPSVDVAFDDSVAVVFANAVGFAGNPVGVDVTGSVSLLGPANPRGAQPKMASGAFHGNVARDEDGDLQLAGVAPGTVVAKGDILIYGEPIGIERTVREGTLLVPPPVVLLQHGGGGAPQWTLVGEGA